MEATKAPQGAEWVWAGTKKIFFKYGTCITWWPQPLSLTFRRRWTGRRSPAGWAGNWVAGYWIWAELQAVALKTKSSRLCLIPGSVTQERQRSRQNKTKQTQKKSSSSLQKKRYKLMRGTKRKVTGTCSFPHRRHLKHPTQSMILEMLRKASLISSWHSQKTQVILNLESYPHKLKLQLQSVLMCVCSPSSFVNAIKGFEALASPYLCICIHSAARAFFDALMFYSTISRRVLTGVARIQLNAFMQLNQKVNYKSLWILWAQTIKNMGGEHSENIH